MIKAIFFDIDGTLVSFNTHTTPSSTRKALSALQKKGIRIFIATGRPKALVEEALDGLTFDGYITMNGAHCYTPDHQDIYKSIIPAEDIERLIAYHHIQPEIPFVFVYQDQWFITHIDDSVKKITQMIEIDFPPIHPIEYARGKEVTQIIGYFSPDMDKQIFGEILTHCEPMRWNPAFTDIILQGTSKKQGIDHLLQHFQIELKDTMAFGDGGNDIPMLTHASIGVAMGNAEPEVQQAADYVTTTVDEEGILNALKHFQIL